VQGCDAGGLIAFSALTTVDVHLGQKLSIYLTYLSDDSYTPSALAIRAGTGLGDLQDVRVVTFEKPEGWITFDISSEPNEEGEGL
jgi:anaphase-promoting complex subunit 10